jgi:hypothetical protein
VIQFLVKEGNTPTDIFRRTDMAYGNDCLARSTVFKCCKEFQSGRETTMDVPRPRNHTRHNCGSGHNSRITARWQLQKASAEAPLAQFFNRTRVFESACAPDLGSNSNANGYRCPIRKRDPRLCPRLLPEPRHSAIILSQQQNP